MFNLDQSIFSSDIASEDRALGYCWNKNQLCSGLNADLCQFCDFFSFGKHCCNFFYNLQMIGLEVIYLEKMWKALSIMMFLQLNSGFCRNQIIICLDWFGWASSPLLPWKHLWSSIPLRCFQEVNWLLTDCGDVVFCGFSVQNSYLTPEDGWHFSVTFLF